MDFSQAASHLNWLAILVSPLAGFVLGAIWYGALFSKAFLRATCITETQARAQNKTKTFGGFFVLNFIAAASLAMFSGPSGTWSQCAIWRYNR